MRDVSAISSWLSNTNLAPMNIVQLDFSKVGGQVLTFADKATQGYNKGIISIGAINDTIDITGASSSTSVDVVLSDTPGVLKRYLWVTDIHKIPCKIKQGSELSPDKVLLFDGEVSSAIVWDEGDRTLSFSVVSKIEDKEIGFSPEEGLFDFLPDSAEGKPWPLVFGTVVNIPCIALREVPVGTSAEAIGIHDYGIETELIRLNKQREEALKWANYYYAVAAQAIYSGDAGISQEYASKADQLVAQAADLQRQKFELSEIMMQQQAYEKTSININDGDKFPQNQTIDIFIGEAKFRGRFSGSVFIIDRQWHPGALDAPSNYPEPPNYTTDNPPAETSLGFWYADAGAQVVMDAAIAIPHVVNIAPSTVHTVTAYRQVEGARKLITVPTSYYSVSNYTYGPYNCTLVTLVKPLSQYKDEGWDDDIYVTLTSSVGPNIVDIFQAVINRYTTMTYDTTSFNHVKPLVDKYPANFVLYEKKNIVQFIKEVAFQSRCAVWVRNNVFYIKYLPEEPTAVASISESDVVVNTLKQTFTNTEDLVTVMNCTWVYDNAVDKPNKYVVRHNVQQYGTIAQDFNFYIYNIRELVEKSATFWINRLANTWRIVKFKTYMKHLALEPFDCIEVVFPDIVQHKMKGIILSTTYDTDEHTIEFEVLTCYMAGSQFPDVFFWPKDISSTEIFPSAEARLKYVAGGNSPGATAVSNTTRYPTTVISSAGAAYAGGGGSISQPRDYGDYTPTDTTDVKPTVQYNNNTLNSAGPAPAWDYKFEDNFVDSTLKADDIVIDLHKTKIHDFINNKVTTLSTFFGITNKNTLYLQTDTAHFGNSEFVGQFSFKWYADASIWLAYGSYLWEE